MIRIKIFKSLATIQINKLYNIITNCWFILKIIPNYQSDQAITFIFTKKLTTTKFFHNSLSLLPHDRV